MLTIEFKPLLTLPEKGNKYFISKSSGKGYNKAILGNLKYRSKDFDVLPNCVSWASGRFHMLAEDPSFSLLPVCNAEDFITYASKSLKIGMLPRVGACMVWSKGKQKNSSDGCGHVAIVEKVVSDTEVIASQSGWSSNKLMWVQNHKKGSDGNWGMKGYKFLGFIYNPASCCQDNNINTTSKIPNKISDKNISNLNTSIPSNLKIKSAKSIDKTLSGTYIVKSNDDLNLRTGPGVDNDIIVSIPNNTKIQNYGYYTLVGNTKWLYIQVVLKGNTYTGFVNSNYLQKK